MSHVIALVGRPNVGKSTLFNRLTRSRDSLVSDYSGLTRDRIYGKGTFDQQEFIVIDTGGLTDKSDALNIKLKNQAYLAMEEADAILFLVDGRLGGSPDDAAIAKQLRRLQKPIYLVANKLESGNVDIACSEFYSLGLGQPYPISASHGQRLDDLFDAVFFNIEQTQPTFDAAEESDTDEASGIKIALIGRPNVGKSTFINQILGEERQVTADESGTTRDSIFIPFEKDGQAYTLIDTAGIRRRGRIQETVEKFSVVKALKALEACHVAIIMLDAQLEVAEQDLRLLGYVLDAGKAVVIAVNKWDHLSRDQKDEIDRELDRKLAFIDYAPIHFISALHGHGLSEVFSDAKRLYDICSKDLTTAELNRALARALHSHQPPMVNGRRPKLRFAHQGGHNPPCILIHGSGLNKVSQSYQRYLEKHFRKTFGLEGTPIKLVFKNTRNPYEKG